MIITPSLPNGFVIFCDDFRPEVSGKVTLVGTYAGDLFINTPLPASLPQICVQINYHVSPKELPKSIHFVVELSKDDAKQELARISIELTQEQLDEVSKAIEQTITDNHDSGFAAMQQYVRLPNLLIEDSCKLQVRAYVEADEIRLGSLRIQSQVQPDAVA